VCELSGAVHVGRLESPSHQCVFPDCFRQVLKIHFRLCPVAVEFAWRNNNSSTWSQVMSLAIGELNKPVALGDAQYLLLLEAEFLVHD
jgi:hypothetical protein